MKKDAPKGVAGRSGGKWNLRNWATFFNERAPPLVYALLASGPSLSCLSYTSPGHTVDITKFLLGSIGLLVLLFLIRIMDEVKDFEKDKVVHPERPLPRGLLQYDEVVTVIHAALVGTLLYAVLLAVMYGPTVGVMYSFVVAFVILMYNEFFVGEWLEEMPLLYGLLHQSAIFIAAFFICSLSGYPWFSQFALLLGSLSLSGFFAFEVCRKLDPTFPKLKGTYLVIYGKWKTYVITMATVSVGAVSAYLLNLHWILWPVQALLLTSLLILFLLPVKQAGSGAKPKAHKPVEAIAVIHVLFHIWAPYLYTLF